MKTLAIIVDDIKRRINNGAPLDDIRVDDREIERMVLNSAHAIFFERVYGLNRQEDDMNIPAYLLESFTRAIQVDADGTNYADVDFKYVMLPKERGIQRVVVIGENPLYRSMIPMPEGLTDVFAALDTSALGGRWQYTANRSRINFSKRCGKTLIESGYTQVRIDVAGLNFDENQFGRNDIFPLGLEHLEELTERVLVKLDREYQRVKDLANDNNPSPNAGG